MNSREIGCKTSLEIAKIVASWTHIESEKKNMLEESITRINEDLKNGRGFYLVDDKNNVRAYGKMEEWPNAGIELGTLVSDPECRHEGWGAKMVQYILNNYDTRDRAVFCLAANPVSAKLFGKKLNAPELDKTNLNEEVWALCFHPEPCGNANKYPNCPCQAFNLLPLIPRKS